MARRVRPIGIVITLECTECRERNYTTEKNRRNDPARLELKKFCPRCRSASACTARRGSGERDDPLRAHDLGL